ncbi:MAG: hypothetical protein WC249_03320 [Patescibacteria group bacterium]|jgi:hypothetical protein
MQKLISYFTDGIKSQTLQTIGAEIETQFVDKNGKPISKQNSQQIMNYLAENGWKINGRKGNLITALIDQSGNQIFYELGRHNIELATAASTPSLVLNVVRDCLSRIYQAAKTVNAEPYFSPILPGDEDLLVIPDERDATWLELDGRDALAPLARTSSVQFTISLAPLEAIKILNNLGERIDSFLLDFPQDKVWKRYIEDSAARYFSNRYGGPLIFDSLEDYCYELSRHDVVQGTNLVPFKNVSDLNIPLYLRSIWWHFRLKRYGNALCLEIRPMARRGDERFPSQLEKVLKIFSL